MLGVLPVAVVMLIYRYYYSCSNVCMLLMCMHGFYGLSSSLSKDFEVQIWADLV